ncbi:MAG TPA: hypothetical protein VF677_14815 [Flavobacterium sp.]|jgi:hypothetical protein
MKKIKLIFTSILLVFIAASCEDDGGTSKIDLVEGAVPNIRKIATTDQGINILALQNGGNINLGLTFDVGLGDISSIDVIGFYTKNGVVERGVFRTNITGFPATVNITQTDLYDVFTSLNSASDIGLTDNLLITAELKSSDGTVIKLYTDNGVRRFGADIANSTLFPVFQTYGVSCPLADASLFNGDYRVTADAWADYAVGDIVPVVYNAANGVFKFRILNTNNPYIVNTSSYYEVTINPANSNVTVVSNEPLDYGTGTTNVTGTGTIGSCTGDINLSLNFSGSSQNQTFTLVKN